MRQLDEIKAALPKTVLKSEALLRSATFHMDSPGCYCHVGNCAPCSHCTNPDNPVNVEADESNYIPLSEERANRMAAKKYLEQYRGRKVEL